MKSFNNFRMSSNFHIYTGLFSSLVAFRTSLICLIYPTSAFLCEVIGFHCNSKHGSLIDVREFLTNLTEMHSNLIASFSIHHRSYPFPCLEV